MSAEKKGVQVSGRFKVVDRVVSHEAPVAERSVDAMFRFLLPLARADALREAQLEQHNGKVKNKD